MKQQKKIKYSYWSDAGHAMIEIHARCGEHIHVISSICASDHQASRHDSRSLSYCWQFYPFFNSLQIQNEKFNRKMALTILFFNANMFYMHNYRNIYQLVSAVDRFRNRYPSTNSQLRITLPISDSAVRTGSKHRQISLFILAVSTTWHYWTILEAF